MTGGNQFGNFKDLQRAFGGGDEGDAAETPAKDPSEWTLEERYEDLLESVRPSVREIIQSAGTSFGPMAHGPECYRDPRTEEMELLASFRVRTVFPPEVLAETQGLPSDPAPEDFAAREDFRGRRIFTIDGEDAKDFDDAIGITPLEDGLVEVSVHIADVSHYVVPGTALDREALSRATSIYVPDQVIPMLPEEISNHLCSLVPNRDRLTFSVLMIFDAKGRRQQFRVTKGIIRSIRRCTYKNVQKLLDGIVDEDTQKLIDLKPDLELFASWTRRQQSIRDEKGSLRLQSSERKFEFDEKHEVKRIYPSAVYFTQALIEETALAANQAVGDFFKERNLPTIYRIHPRKDPEEVQGVIEMLTQFGVRVPDKEQLSGRDVGRMVREARRRPNGEALIARIMGLVERAVYEVAQGEEDSAEHWGLAREHYLHFTSPIRRYPDLIVHRWLHAVLSSKSASEELVDPEMVAELTDVATHCTMQADLADMVESAIDDLKVCQYMDRFIDAVIDARISRVSPGGLEVFLKDHYVTGFIPARTLDGRRKVEGSRMTVVSRRGARVFDEGEPIRVKVSMVDFVRLQVVLEVVF